MTFNRDVEWRALTVGAVIGGPQTSPAIDDALMSVTRAAEMTQRGSSVGPTEHEASINVIFQVSGDVAPTDHVGLRTGRFTRAKRLLAIEVGVPDDLRPEAVRTYFAKALVEAVELAEGHLAKTASDLSVRRAKAAAVATMEMVLGPWGAEPRPADLNLHD